MSSNEKLINEIIKTDKAIEQFKTACHKIQLHVDKSNSRKLDRILEVVGPLMEELNDAC